MQRYMPVGDVAKWLRIEIVEPAEDQDRILEHYVIELKHPIAQQVLARLRTEVRVQPSAQTCGCDAGGVSNSNTHEIQNDDLTIIRQKALAARLGVSTVTLWRMRDQLPAPIQITGRIKGWRVSDIRIWQEQRSAR